MDKLIVNFQTIKDAGDIKLKAIQRLEKRYSDRYDLTRIQIKVDQVNKLKKS